MNNSINTAVTRIGSRENVGGLMGVLDTAEKVCGPGSVEIQDNSRDRCLIVWCQPLMMFSAFLCTTAFKGINQQEEFMPYPAASPFFLKRMRR